jgi:phosphoribosyl 1,2-cyclic phosphodiesterase
VGRGLDDLGAVLLTHGHGDHTSGVPRLVKQCGVPVYSAPGVGEEFGGRIVEPGEVLDLGRISAEFFEVPHDTPTYGLRISDGTAAAAIVTDLGELPERVMSRMRGVEAAVIEANHDEDWLWGGPYPRELKRRVASPAGHLSNSQAADAALALVPHGLKDLVLAHLSERNNSPARACGTARSVLRKAGHADIRVRAAMAGHPTPPFEVGTPLAGREYVYRYTVGDEGGGDGIGRAAGRLFEVE